MSTKVVSSPEEIAHYCHQFRGQHFKITTSTYQCFGGEGSKCTGSVNPTKKLPTCSQPVIASCEDETVYADFNDHSRGPCSLRRDDMLWHSAKCGNGKFSCWDPKLDAWCEGDVDDSSVSIKNVSCPPTTVYSQHEATHYCSQSGLATRLDPKDVTRYNCLEKDGSAVCAGRIDSRRHISCSTLRVNGCEAIDKVCKAGQKAYCDEKLSTFECWDEDLDRWCLGQLVKPYTKAGTKTPIERPATTSYIAQERTHHWGIFIPAGLVVLSFVLVGRYYDQVFREGAGLTFRKLFLLHIWVTTSHFPMTWSWYHLLPKITDKSLRQY